MGSKIQRSNSGLARDVSAHAGDPKFRRRRRLNLKPRKPRRSLGNLGIPVRLQSGRRSISILLRRPRGCGAGLVAALRLLLELAQLLLLFVAEQGDDLGVRLVPQLLLERPLGVVRFFLTGVDLLSLL